MLRTLDLRSVERILVALPDQFERDGQNYTIPEALKQFPKVTFLHAEQDRGPATKIIPSLEYIGRLDADSLVISIDDDVGLPFGTINELILAAVSFPDAVIGSAGQALEFWGIRERTGVSSTAKYTLNIDHTSVVEVDLVEGFGAIGYRARLVDISLIKKLLQMGNECRVSDDLVICMSLAHHNVQRLQFSSRYYDIGLVSPYPYGYRSDALQRGAGLSSSVMAEASSLQINSLKYQIAYQAIRKALGGGKASKPGTTENPAVESRDTGDSTAQ